LGITRYSTTITTITTTITNHYYFYYYHHYYIYYYYYYYYCYDDDDDDDDDDDNDDDDYYLAALRRTARDAHCLLRGRHLSKRRGSRGESRTCVSSSSIWGSSLWVRLTGIVSRPLRLTEPGRRVRAARRQLGLTPAVLPSRS
jgi:hypothetical protein